MNSLMLSCRVSLLRFTCSQDVKIERFKCREFMPHTHRKLISDCLTSAIAKSCLRVGDTIFVRSDVSRHREQVRKTIARPDCEWSNHFYFELFRRPIVCDLREVRCQPARTLELFRHILLSAPKFWYCKASRHPFSRGCILLVCKSWGQ